MHESDSVSVRIHRGWVVRRLLLAVVAVALLGASIVPPANAQVQNPSTYAYPMPGKAGEPEVRCTTCVSTTTKDRPTWPYSLPIKRFVGRMLDSARTRDIQAPIRTLRARDVRVAPENGRLYVMFGGSRFVGWNLNTFFTADLGKPLSQLSPTYNITPELFLPYPTYVDADTDGAWRTIQVDGQNRLGAFDWDDRGLVYLAYGPYGWGIVKDLPSGFSFVTQVTDKGSLVSTNSIQVLRSGSTYYAVLMNPTGSSQSAIFDASNSTTPNFIGYVDKAPISFEKITSDKSQGIQDDIFGAIAAGTQVLELYTTTQFVNGRGPSKTFTPATGLYKDITTDGTNFYAMHGVGANQDIDVISPTRPGDATSYAITQTYHIPGGASAGELRWGGGYLTLSSRDSQNIPDIRLFKVTSGEIKDIDLGKFFQKYYATPPAGYAKPDGNTSLFTSSVVYSTGGHDYLIFESYGMADVYELQAGDSVDIAINTAAGYGTPNANSPSTGGPYYGDPISFSSVASTSAAMTLNWNFGNSESPDNTTTSLSGVAAVHQFSGLTTSSQILGGRTVTATNALDSTISDTQPVTMFVPEARVGVARTSIFLQSNASAIAFVPGDRFVDASDGSIQGHYGIWTIDGTPLTGTPPESQPVGTCGAHTLSFEAHYVPYTGTGAAIVPAMSSASHYISDVSNLAYTVKPFIAGLKVLSYDASNVTFKNIARAASTSTFATGAQWTVDLQFLNAAGGVVSPPVAKTSTIGTQDTFVITKSLIATAKKAVLTITVDPTAITDFSCASTTQAVAEMPISIPDPSIKVSGCGNVGSPCSLTAVSLSDASLTEWKYQWKLNGVATSTAATYTPIISSAGSYNVELSATNAFGFATAVKALSVLAPLCTGKPTNISLGVSCTTCTTSTVVKFTPYAFSPYAFQTCDSFSWSFGDGQSSNLKTPTHQYTRDGSYTVKLTVTNSNGSGIATTTVQIGNVAPPPPACPTVAPSNIYFNLTAASGCTAANPNCKTLETITFTPAPWGYSLQTCDEYLWSFGDGISSTTRNASHSYTNPGTYPVKLTVSNDKGSNTAATINVVITGGGGGSCAAAPGQFIDMTYSGPTSGCVTAGSTPCGVNETVSFAASAFGYVFQACDTFSWNFGDGLAGATGKTTSHKFTGNGTFKVKLTVTNTNGTSIGERNVVVGTGGGGGTPPPVVDFTISNPAPAVGATVNFAGSIVSGTVTSWSWTFGDSAPRGTSQNVSHAYANPGTFTVTLTAANEGGSTVVAKTVTVIEANTFAFLLPVVTHLDNADGNGGKWQTDFHIFNPTPNFDPGSPMNLTFEFKGQTKTLPFDKSTDIREDFLNYLTTEKTTWSVIVRGTGDYPPQMWTRTYFVSSSGVGKYGQFIPAIPLTGQTTATATAPKQYLPGLQFGPKESSSKFRTNIGLINPSPTAAEISMAFLDKDGLPVGTSFNTTIQRYSLVQVNDGQIRGTVPQLVPGKGYTVELNSSSPGMVAYASMIDNTSNDPVFVQSVSETDAAGAERKVQILPGLAHVGEWRSDVSIFNADSHTIQFDMELLGTDGSRIVEAKSLTLGGSQALQLDDLLNSANPLPVPVGTQLGTLRLTTNIGSQYPIIFSRTYNDRGAEGTFGQGIPAFSGTEGNVKAGTPSYIAGVRSNSSYYTNLGLVSTSAEASTVLVKFLDPIWGLVIGERSYTVNPGQSMIIGSATSDYLHDLRNPSSSADEGTLQIDVTSGGSVWAFVSIIDKLTLDPEYVPATPSN